MLNIQISYAVSLSQLDVSRYRIRESIFPSVYDPRARSCPPSTWALLSPNRFRQNGLSLFEMYATIARKCFEARGTTRVSISDQRFTSRTTPKLSSLIDTVGNFREIIEHRNYSGGKLDFYKVGNVEKKKKKKFKKMEFIKTVYYPGENLYISDIETRYENFTSSRNIHLIKVISTSFSII